MANSISRDELEDIRKTVIAAPEVVDACDAYAIARKNLTALNAQHSQLLEANVALQSIDGGDRELDDRVRMITKKTIRKSHSYEQAKKQIGDVVRKTVEETGALQGVSEVAGRPFDKERFITDTKKEIFRFLESQHESSAKQIRKDALRGMVEGMLGVVETAQGRKHRAIMKIKEARKDITATHGDDLFPDSTSREPLAVSPATVVHR